MVGLGLPYCMRTTSKLIKKSNTSGRIPAPPRHDEMRMAWRGGGQKDYELSSPVSRTQTFSRRRATMTVCREFGLGAGGNRRRTGFSDVDGRWRRKKKTAAPLLFFTAKKQKFQEETKRSTKPNPTTTPPFQKGGKRRRNSNPADRTRPRN